MHYNCTDLQFMLLLYNVFFNQLSESMHMVIFHKDIPIFPSQVSVLLSLTYPVADLAYFT